MIKFIPNLFGGRPMTCTGSAFTDRVSGKTVKYYTCRNGREWLADSGPWSLFRVPRDSPQRSEPRTRLTGAEIKI